MKPFAKMFNYLLEGRDITVEKIAKDTGISVNKLRHYKRGASEPSLGTLKLLARYFKVPADFLLREYDDSTNEQS